MSPTVLYLLALGAMLLLSAPLFLLIGAATVLGYVLFGDVQGFMDVTIIENVRELTDKPPLLAIPFFVLSGSIMSHGAIAGRLVNVAKAVFSPLPGGLGIATVAACMFFAAISGSSPVTVITIGGVMYPAMVAAGYHERFSTGLVTSAGTLGILIPPSIPMIVYAIFASGTDVIRVEDLFLAGLGPGVLIGLILGAYCMIMGIRKGERFTRPDLGAVWDATVDGFWSLMLPVVILGGIYSGIFTATEAAAVSVVYALAVELFVHRELTLKEVPAVVGEATILMGSLLVIFAMAVGLNALLTDLGIPEAAANWITSLDLTPTTFMLLLNGFLLLVGCLMDIISAIMILVPLLAPMASLCGIDPIHLGVVFIVNLELGYLTPPMGLNLFVSSSIFNKGLSEVIRSVVPFTGLLLIAVLIVTYVPTVSLGPVNALNDKPVYVAFPDGKQCTAPAVDDGELGAEDEDGSAEGDDGSKSISDLMEDDDVKALLDDDGSDDSDDAADDDGQPKSIQQLMKDDDVQDLLNDEPAKAPKAPVAAPSAPAQPKSIQEMMKDDDVQDLL
ncbi:MAG: TRAP transporter large permease subunit, partial [Myxococcales bacterium]|nr:TRAP transporter large permease subunit [Myxococcales bacterium]